MGTRVRLPGDRKGGAFGLEFPDGHKTPAARPGSTITIDDRYAAQIGTSNHGRLGTMSAGTAESIGTRKGRRCDACRRTWQAWSVLCPRCGAATDQA